MDDAKQGKRRFAPMHIETTFEQIRRPGPVGELTPDPSPEPSPLSPPRNLTLNAPLLVEPVFNESRRERRRFAPQLIDSSRRSRRVGDVGPATRPTDKTDIVPYHNHIYSVHRNKKRHHRTMGMARRESCDEETADHMFDLAKKDLEKRLQEIALSAFPNSSARIGGAEHFVMREGSDDDNELDPRGRPQVRLLGAERPRRESTDEDMNWHVKEAQDAADRRARSRMDTKDLDMMELDTLPPDTMFLTSSRKETPSPGPVPFNRGPIGESHMPLISHTPLKPIGETPLSGSSSPPPIQPIGEYQMPYILPTNLSKGTGIPAETGFARFGGGARPFGGTGGLRRDGLSSAKNLEQLRQRSPPMLGKDITFRMCPSPKRTKMEPDHLWARIPEASNRDPTGTKGLWRGYCYTAEADSGRALAVEDRPALIHTPSVTSSAGTDPFSAAFGTFDTMSTALSEEPTPVASPRGTHSAGPASLKLPKPAATVPPASNAKRRSAEAKGLHMLAGLEERLRKEKAAADLTEQIQAEFTDQFVTQVYNYLSLGYPAMARAYDEELSKISRIPIEDLRSNDAALLDFVVEVASGGGSKRKAGTANGHIRLTEDDDTKEQDRCPRWKALKLYIHEWARQHPDLDSINPLAWGVRERRGSWGI